MHANTTHDNRRARLWRIGLPSIVALVVVLSASAALAQQTELGGKIRGGDQVIVPAGETVEGDLYASGRAVRVDGVVTGDLLAVGGELAVAGEVTGDVMAAGGSIVISGQVGGDVRAAGGQLTVSGSVGEDLFVAGGQVTLASSGQVGEDLVFGAGQLTLDGTVAGDVLGSGGDYNRRGTVGGTENVTISQPEERVPTAADRILAALAVSGALALVLVLVGTLLAISLGLAGLGELVGTVIFTLIVALIALAFVLFLAVVFGAPAGVGMALGDLVIPEGVTARPWWSLIGGVLVVVVAASLPVIGGLLAFIVVVFGLGAIILALAPRRESVDIAEPIENP
jgi:cytoskeletal protein CcmA (bactofilin family)